MTNPNISTPPISTNHHSIKLSFPTITPNNEKLYKQYDNVNICILRDNPPDFGIVKQHFDRHTPITFTQESDNPYDNKAVAVFLKYYKIGYLYKGTLKDMINDFISRGETVVGMLTNVDTSEQKIEMNIAFYKEITRNDLIIKLSGSSGEAAQDALYCSSVGDSVYIEFDYDKLKYYVDNGFGRIGYIPEKYEDNINSGNAVIYKIDESNNGKLSAKIIIL